MKNTKCYILDTNRRGAFTIVELLMALVITGILLVAVAVAFNASVINYRENENIFKATNTARQALTRITTHIRTGLVDPNNMGNQNICRVLNADNSEVTYQYYDSGPKNGQLYLATDAGQEYLLCDNITSMSFVKNPTDNGFDVKSVLISMTVQSDNVERKVSSAAVVRRVLE